MHTRETFDESEAVRVLEHVKRFMTMLAEKEERHGEKLRV
jgi:hypothetical protein